MSGATKSSKSWTSLMSEPDTNLAPNARVKHQVSDGFLTAALFLPSVEADIETLHET